MCGSSNSNEKTNHSSCQKTNDKHICLFPLQIESIFDIWNFLFEKEKYKTAFKLDLVWKLVLVNTKIRLSNSLPSTIFIP